LSEHNRKSSKGGQIKNKNYCEAKGKENTTTKRAVANAVLKQ
jgi:hypothetical protein